MKVEKNSIYVLLTLFPSKGLDDSLHLKLAGCLYKEEKSRTEAVKTLLNPNESSENPV